VIDAHPSSSTYMLELLNPPNIFPTFHTSELKRFILNNTNLFPGHQLPQPGPILTPDGLEEYHVEEITDSCPRGHGQQYLVQWTRYGAEHDRWISTTALQDCEALDRWFSEHGDGPDKQ
jgi:hypothetical protein